MKHNNMTNGNEPINLGSEVDKCGNPIKEHLGLTKREYFAAMAMQGLWQSTPDPNYEKYDVIAKMSVLQADALINALNETK